MSYALCNNENCNNIFKIRKKVAIHRQCSKCWSNDIRIIKDRDVIKYITKGMKIRHKDQPKRAAPKKEILEPEQIKEYPECFGDRNYLTIGRGINHQDCFDCKYYRECKSNVVLKK